MSADQRTGALETLKSIRKEQFPQVPEDLLVAVFNAETDAQFETDRGQTIARIRDLILPPEAAS